MMISRILKKAVVFDAFPKVDAGYQDKSPQGGFITIVVSILLWFLIISEFREYLNLNQKYQFSVDQNIYHQLQINVDITVNTPCNLITVDVVDVAGERIHVTDKLKVVPTVFKVGSAHRLGDETVDIRPDIWKMLVEAKSKATFSNSNDNSNDSGLSACRVFGYFDVNKVTGNLHITAIGLGYGGYSLQNLHALNFTHRIDEFSFGTFYPSLVNPLDNSIEISETNMETFKYFLSVVPTTYIDNNKRVLLTSQYSVTEYSKSYEVSKGQFGIPGIFFKYDIEPISVQITEKGPGFIKFMTRLCGL
ncbi:11564_t:CDS:2, partial [Acaulospora morrowiae]